MLKYLQSTPNSKKIPQIENIRTIKKKEGDSGIEKRLKSPNYVYIGRNMSLYHNLLTQSKFANVFKLANYNNNLVKVLELYETYVRTNKDLYEALDELYGKTLLCWCIDCRIPSKTTNPKCHGQVLVNLLIERKS